MPLPSHLQKADEEFNRLKSGEPAGETPAESRIEVQPADPKQSKEYLELDKRFRNLKASQDKTIHELRTQVAELEPLRDQIRESQETVKQLKAQIEAMKERPAEHPRELLSSEERDEWDEDFTNVVSKISRNEAARIRSELESVYQSTIDSLQQKINTLESTVNEARTETSQEATHRFFNELTAAIPNWQELQVRPEFQQKLAEVDPNSTLYPPFVAKTYDDLLQEYLEAKNSQAAIALFKKLAGETGAQPANIVPEGTGSGEVALPNEGKRIYTETEFRDISTDLAIKLARRKITPERAREIERELHAAFIEGRVRK